MRAITTSNRFSTRRLGAVRWRKLHRLVYLAGMLVVVHYAWAKKGDLFRLQGDIWLPLAAGVLLLFMLLVRVPAVRDLARNTRNRLKRRLPRASYRTQVQS